MLRFDRISLFTCLLLAGVLSAGSATAAPLYRYQDEQGNTVLNSTIPPEYVAKGYQILSAQGRVLETIPPALTKEQIAERDAEKTRKAAEALAHKEQSIQDKELKLLYSHPNDIVRILQRRLQDAQAIIQLRQGQIDSAQKQIAALQGKAADAQRKGKEIPDNLLGELAKARKEIDNGEADIEKQKHEMQRVVQEFDVKIKRMEILTEQTASDYQTLLESAFHSPQNATPPPESPSPNPPN